MPWFKTDDVFWRHRKVRKLGRDKLPAIGLWLLAGSWCADNLDENLTDGFVPREQVESWDPRLRYAKRLVDAGLWGEAEHDGERGYEFHDWAEYQKTRAEVEAEREEWRQKKRKSRGRKVSPGDTPGDTNGDSTKDSRQSPGTRSRTRTRSSSGHLGEGRPVPNASGAPRPPERCSEHTNDPHPGPCGKCADARRAAEAWDDAETERAEQISRNIEAAIADPRQRCEHGTDGGRFQHPLTGKSATCALCRRANTTREAS
ncbi:hypothetical protein [Amycolatopsis thermoflava]|uniref:hypothetical protein n=1 Tax=Amycolatopsis thermoflava TaxID=84480 RepID=UPI003F49E517